MLALRSLGVKSFIIVLVAPGSHLDEAAAIEVFGLTIFLARLAFVEVFESLLLELCLLLLVRVSNHYVLKLLDYIFRCGVVVRPRHFVFLCNFPLAPFRGFAVLFLLGIQLVDVREQTRSVVFHNSLSDKSVSIDQLSPAEPTV